MNNSKYLIAYHVLLNSMFLCPLLGRLHEQLLIVFELG